MHLLWIILVGFVAGWIVGHLTRGRGFGLLGDIIVGILGSWVGSFIFGLTGIAAYNTIGSILMSVVGALALLFLISLIRSSRSSAK